MSRTRPLHAINLELNDEDDFQVGLASKKKRTIS